MRVRDVVQHAYVVQSTIQWEVGVTVVRIGFATRGHTRRQHVVLYLTPYVLTAAQSTTQLALFVRVKVAVFPTVLRLLLFVNLEQTECSLRLAPLMHYI